MYNDVNSFDQPIKPEPVKQSWLSNVFESGVNSVKSGVNSVASTASWIGNSATDKYLSRKYNITEDVANQIMHLFTPSNCEVYPYNQYYTVSGFKDNKIPLQAFNNLKNDELQSGNKEFNNFLTKLTALQLGMKQEDFDKYIIKGGYSKTKRKSKKSKTKKRKTKKTKRRKTKK